MTSEWGDVAESFRAAARAHTEAEAAALSSDWAALDTGVKERILSMDASQLVAAIAAGEVKSVDAVLTFTERCYHIGCHQINAVTETFFEAAVAAARATVRAFPSPPDPRPATTSRRWCAQDAAKAGGGALEGLPISLKDCFDLEGSHSTIGITARTRSPGAHTGPDGLMARILKDAGKLPRISLASGLHSSQDAGDIVANRSDRHLQNQHSSGPSRRGQLQPPVGRYCQPV